MATTGGGDLDVGIAKLVPNNLGMEKAVVHPRLRFNLASVSQLTLNGYEVRFNRSAPSEVVCPNGDILPMEVRGGLIFDTGKI